MIVELTSQFTGCARAAAASANLSLTSTSANAASADTFSLFNVISMRAGKLLLSPSTSLSLPLSSLLPSLAPSLSVSAWQSGACVSPRRSMPPSATGEDRLPRESDFGYCASLIDCRSCPRLLRSHITAPGQQPPYCGPQTSPADSKQLLASFLQPSPVSSGPLAYCRDLDDYQYHGSIPKHS